MDGGRVDDDAEDARVAAPAGPPRRGRRRTRRRAARGWCRRPAWCRRGGRGTLGDGDRLGRRVEDDRREVEQDAVEDDGQVGVGPGVQPQRGGAAVEVGQRLRVQLLRVVAAQLDADVATARRGGAGDGAATSSARSGVPSGADGDAVEGRAGELRPHGVVGVVVAEPAGLAEHGGRGLLPVGAGRGGVRAARARGCPGRAPAPAGSARPPSTRSCGVMVRTLGAARDPSHTL